MTPVSLARNSPVRQELLLHSVAANVVQPIAEESVELAVENASAQDLAAKAHAEESSPG